MTHRFNVRAHTLRIVAALLMSLLLVPAAVAHAGGDDPDHPAKDHHAKRHVAVFGGLAQSSGHSNFALGADFEYRLPFLGERLGLGAITDVVFSEYTHVLAGGALFLHPGKGFKLVAAPGFAFEHGHRNFSFRTGVAYEAHVGSVSVTPTLNFDFSHGHTTRVFGLALGKSF